ncbi:proteinase-activated receptor 4 [Pseudonaja textilis]|uniref:proteinase-activated receptor 4 n=1 Tax=Pseudonaja textilis TaxID=8673 RepID=UPI000EAAA1BE|nr:proteinase-activated receptor 4 [Pseudonaja textilis]
MLPDSSQHSEPLLLTTHRMSLGDTGTRGYFLPLLLLCCWMVSASGVADYDDYSLNGTDENQQEQPNCLFPRSIPGEVVTENNTSFLSISEKSRASLNGTLTVVVLPSFYTLIFLIGLPANALALWVLTTKVEKLPSTVFLINLATADLLLCLLLPLKISYYFLGNHWPFGEAMCRFTTMAFYGNMYCSIILLACISMDRYLAVAHPFFARSFRSSAFAMGICAVVWVVAVLFTLPLTVHRQSFPLYETKQTLCHDVLPWEQEEQHYYYFIILIACGFLTPFLIMVFSCGITLWVLLGSGEKYAMAAKLTALMLISVTAFYSPSHILLLLDYSRSCLRKEGTFYVPYMASLALSTCNSCVDPFIYYYVSEEFRLKVKRRLFGHRKDSAVSIKTSKETLPSKTFHHSHCPG